MKNGVSSPEQVHSSVNPPYTPTESRGPLSRRGLRIVSPYEQGQFHQQGFLRITDLVPQSSIADVRTILDRLYANHRREHGSIENPLQLAPELRRSLVFRTALGIAKQLLGITAMYACDCALYKEPHGLHGTPWHQDRAFHGRFFPNNIIAFWIPLQDATTDNGCLHYIPTRPGQALLPHRPYYPNDYSSMMTDCVDPNQAVVCPVQAGGATVHGPLTLHSALPNRTSFIRRTWLLTFRPLGRLGFLAPSHIRQQATLFARDLIRG